MLRAAAIKLPRGASAVDAANDVVAPNVDFGRRMREN